MPSGDESLPATLGGSGLCVRTRSHRQDVAEGRIWRTCGSGSETEPLREVMLGWPPDTLASPRPADEDLLLERPDLARMRKEALRIGDYFRSNGVVVHWVRDDAAPPNV